MQMAKITRIVANLTRNGEITFSEGFAIISAVQFAADPGEHKKAFVDRMGVVAQQAAEELVKES